MADRARATKKTVSKTTAVKNVPAVLDEPADEPADKAAERPESFATIFDAVVADLGDPIQPWEPSRPPEWDLAGMFERHGCGLPGDLPSGSQSDDQNEYGNDQNDSQMVKTGDA
jgi:hypothetical protein